MYSTGQWKGKRQPRRIRGAEGSNPRTHVYGSADSKPDVRGGRVAHGRPDACICGFANARVRDRVHFSITPRMCKSIEVVKNGTNEFGYEKSSCLAIAQRTHNLEDPETPRKRRNFRQQEVAVLTTQKVQDHRVSGRPLNREASKEAH